MKAFLLADIHLTHNRRDAYRLDLFRQVDEVLDLNPDIEYIILAGDSTEFKDNHPSELVNTIVKEFSKWADRLNGGIIVLMGNHDAKDLTTPYFKFLNEIPGLEFLINPQLSILGGREFLFLPHCKKPTSEWKNLDFTNKIVVGHVMVDGAFSEAGFQLESQVDSKIFDSALKAYSGDIHTPQTVGKLTYIGAPYQIDFNDSYEGRGIILDLTTLEETIHVFDFPKKLTLDITTAEDAKQMIDQHKKDGVKKAQIKVRLQINQTNLGEWQTIKTDVFNLVKNAGFDMGTFELRKQGVATQSTLLSKSEKKYTDFKTFCTQKGISDELIKAGESIIKEGHIHA